MLFYTEYPSPVGRLTLAGDETRLMGLWIEGQRYFLASLPETPVRRDGLPPFDAARAWLDRYFAGARPSPEELPLAPSGTPFRQRVWRRLAAIPYGENWPPSWATRPGRWGARWGTIPSPSSSPATGWWEGTAPSPGTPEALT